MFNTYLLEGNFRDKMDKGRLDNADITIDQVKTYIKTGDFSGSYKMNKFILQNMVSISVGGAIGSGGNLALLPVSMVGAFLGAYIADVAMEKQDSLRKAEI